MKLSANFTIDEFTRSDLALRHGIDNSVPSDLMDNVILTASMLEGVRKLLNAPIIITSGYRCKALNDLLGSSETSAHRNGSAVDFIAPQAGSPLDICKRLAIKMDELHIDQMIYEGAWVHLAFPPYATEPRYEILTAHFMPGKKARYTLGLA